MRATVQRWVNSLAIRIPKAMADQAGLRLNGHVDLSLKGGKVVVAPEPEPTFTLEELLAKVTPRNLHTEWDTGSRVGMEGW
jgi:antitoxin MazE